MENGGARNKARGGGGFAHILHPARIAASPHVSGVRVRESSWLLDTCGMIKPPSVDRARLSATVSGNANRRGSLLPASTALEDRSSVSAAATARTSAASSSNLMLLVGAASCDLAFRKVGAMVVIGRQVPCFFLWNSASRHPPAWIFSACNSDYPELQARESRV